MRVRVDLKIVKLIKTFNPHVDVDKLYLPVENVFEQREPSIREKKFFYNKKTKKSEQEEYDFIYWFARQSFDNFKVVSDTKTYYVIVDGIVISVPHDIEISYGFSLENFMLSDFDNQTKHISNLQKAAIVNLYFSKQQMVSKHVFKAVFIDFFTNKDYQNKKMNYGNPYTRNISCEFNYKGYDFVMSSYSNVQGNFVEIKFPQFAFKKSYPTKAYNINKFILDFVNEKEYNCSSMSDAVNHLDDYILLRQMTTI